ncbi:Mobile element protein [uncultured Candidatus Thioglobus sp.]|nr:Mobile element protein [uncultured Candidatus Thioglobus sp.]SMN02322.1 Mobile element protein [uncultured Candidatus Thioglobus sp.]
MPYNHLTIIERTAIFYRGMGGDSIRSIARYLDRSHSTVCREIKRNTGVTGSYVNEYAQRYADTRKAKPRHNRKWKNQALRDYVITQLSIKFTPEIISNRIKIDDPRNKQMRIGTECIYQWIYQDVINGGKLYKNLPRCHKKRRKQLRYDLLRGLLPNRRSIHERAKSINNRVRYGHWEGDTIFGTRSSGYIATFVERKSRYLICAKLCDKTAQELANKAINLFANIPKKLIKTLTLDNGKEFAQFKRIEKSTGIVSYFADPYSSWQRGTNEQVNGLVRRYFPKKMSFENITDKMVQEVANKINNRPRKCLNYRTPAEVLGGGI